jgi:hypothetical protein
LLYLIGFGLALIGTVFLSYGYIAYPQGIAPRKATLASLPAQPRGQEFRDLVGYTQNVYRFFEAYFKAQALEDVRQTKLELRTQLSLAGGMILLGLGFLVHIVAQFL